MFHGVIYFGKRFIINGDVKMEKRYQVFVSSTYDDLQEERKEVMQALLELDCIPAGMELFPASSEEQWSLIKRVIDDSDYYVLIIGGRYGSVNSEGKSYTQMEYEYALSVGKPIIAFLPKNPDNIPNGKCESSRAGKKKLEDFKMLASKKLVKFWTDPANLGSLVSRSVIMLIKNFPANGWVRAENIVDESSIKEISRLQKENDALRKQIEKLSTEAPDGSEQFVQGDDFFEVIAHYYESGNSEKSRTTHIKFTWNQLFGQVAPKLLAPCSNIMFQAAFKPLLNDAIIEIDKSIAPELVYSYISDNSFDQIKIQLRVLGLIKLYRDTAAKKRTEEYWQLTPYGDYKMMELLAIKRK